MFFNVNKSISLDQRNFFWINKTFFNSSKFFLWPYVREMFFSYKETVFSVSLEANRLKINSNQFRVGLIQTECLVLIIRTSDSEYVLTVLNVHWTMTIFSQKFIKIIILILKRSYVIGDVIPSVQNCNYIFRMIRNVLETDFGITRISSNWIPFRNFCQWYLNIYSWLISQL